MERLYHGCLNDINYAPVVYLISDIFQIISRPLITHIVKTFRRNVSTTVA
ncbi:MAG: hypothetical protein KME54_03930 [Tolypothrix brevis GSE-NOS-MK-07-07A]|nr:hypothetical protein [Tolypothrix brevis GSE-NOS-MK-07-07A]